MGAYQLESIILIQLQILFATLQGIVRQLVGKVID